jgi:hypothetical protein
MKTFGILALLATAALPGTASACEMKDWNWSSEYGYLTVEGVVTPANGERKIVIDIYESKGKDQRGDYIGSEDAYLRGRGTFKVMRLSDYAGKRISISYVCE